VPHGQRGGSLWPYSRFSRQEPLLLYQVGPEEDLESGSKEMLDFVQTDIQRGRTTRRISLN
jgi:hypothetical protein